MNIILHNQEFNSGKSNDEDMSILLRFPEREGMAETFLTRKEHLPPLNFSCERLVAADGSNRYLN